MRQLRIFFLGLVRSFISDLENGKKTVVNTTQFHILYTFFFFSLSIYLLIHGPQFQPCSLPSCQHHRSFLGNWWVLVRPLLYSYLRFELVSSLLEKLLVTMLFSPLKHVFRRYLLQDFPLQQFLSIATLQLPLVQARLNKKQRRMITQKNPNQEPVAELWGQMGRTEGDVIA